MSQLITRYLYTGEQIRVVKNRRGKKMGLEGRKRTESRKTDKKQKVLLV